MLLTYCGNIDAHVLVRHSLLRLSLALARLALPPSVLLATSCARTEDNYSLSAHSQRTHMLQENDVQNVYPTQHLHEQWKTHCRKIRKSTVMGRRDLALKRRIIPYVVSHNV